jgi:hypothetical protein
MGAKTGRDGGRDEGAMVWETRNGGGDMPAAGAGGDKTGSWAARVCGGATIQRFDGVEMWNREMMRSWCRGGGRRHESSPEPVGGARARRSLSAMEEAQMGS